MRLAQPDARSCGAAVLVMARMLGDRDYAAGLREPGRFADETLAKHRAVTASHHAGRAQLPWPRALGTPPWAVSRELEQITGRDYEVAAVGDRDAAYERMATRATERSPVAVFIGTRWLPRHVVLVVSQASDDTGEALWTYEPASGRVVRVRRQRWVEGPLDLAGWDRPWLVVSPAEFVPAGRHSRA